MQMKNKEFVVSLGSLALINFMIYQPDYLINSNNTSDVTMA